MLEVGLAELLGFRFGALGPDEVTITWTTGPEHFQPFGLVHGGVYCTAVETAASIGGQLWYGDRGQVVGVSNHTDFLRPVSSGALTAVGTPIHRGRSQQLWGVEIRDEQDRLVARGQVRLQNLPGLVTAPAVGPGSTS